MASSSRTSLLAKVARLSTTNSSNSMTARCMPIFRRSFILLASRRGGFPQQRLPFPSELLLPRAFSTSSPFSASVAEKRRSSGPSSLESEDALSEDVSLASKEAIPDSRVPIHTLRGVIHENTLKAMTVHPFKHTHMSPVQEHILPLLPDLALPHDQHPSTTSPSMSHHKPRDLLVKAKTGTGKTMAFLVPAIEARVKAISDHVESSLEQLKATGLQPNLSDRLTATRRFATQQVGTLIISPTRELASQIAVEAMNLTHHHKGFQVQLLLGGESKGRQLREWRGRKDVVVATPGRLLDLLNSEDSVRDAIQHAKLLILDEADTLLDMGFKADIEMINSYLPPTPQRQTFLFSATVSRAIQEIARDTLSRSHKFVNCVSVDDSPVHAHIPQYHTVIPSGQDAFPHLLRLIAQDQLIKLASADKRGKSEPSKVIVFFNTTKMVQLFSDMLRQAQSALPLARQTRIYEIHSKRDMKQRVRVSDGFRHDKGPASVLVTSDVSARGVDYPGVTRVIQMGVPAGRDIYIHRVGRTGRAGKTDGRGDLVISSWELPFLKQMADVGLKPVTVAEVKRDVEERAAAVGVSSPHLASLDNHAMSISSATNAHEISEAYMSQLGFFLGHIQSLGLVQPDVVNGVGKYFQDLGALEAPPMMSRSMQERLRLGSAKYERKGQGNRGGFGGRGSYADRDRERGAGNRRPAWGTYASGKDFRGLGRHERERSPWESRGDSDRYAGFSRKGRDGARSNEGYGFSKDRGSRRNARFDEY